MSWRGIPPRAILVALSLLAASTPAFAQGRLEVTLLNAANHQPVAGAEVRLENPAIGSSATERTSAPRGRPASPRCRPPASTR